MKKTLLISLICIVSFQFINAQDVSEETDSTFGFRKGDFTISGSLQIINNSTKNNFNPNFETDSKDFRFNPSFGYAISDHFILNTGLTIRSFKPEFADVSGFGWLVGTTYVFSPQKKFTFTLNFNAYFDKTEWDYSERLQDVYDLTQNSFRLQLIPGINFFLSENFALVFNVGEISYATSDTDAALPIRESESNRTVFDINLSNVQIGGIIRF